MDEQGFSATELLQACRALKENGIKHITLDQIKLQMHSGKNTGNNIADNADISWFTCKSVWNDVLNYPSFRSM